MATNNSLNISAAGLVRYDGAGTFTGVTVTQHSLIVGGAANSLTSLGVATNGQIAIGSTGADPVLATLTAGSGVSITNGAGSISIAVSGGGLSWTDVTGTTQALSVNNGYVADNAALVTLTLPATAVFGSILRIVGKGAGGWLIAQNALQQILFGSSSTTAGVTGSLASINANDSVELLATTAGSSTIWTVIDSVGNITIV